MTLPVFLDLETVPSTFGMKQVLGDQDQYKKDYGILSVDELIDLSVSALTNEIETKQYEEETLKKLLDKETRSSAKSKIEKLLSANDDAIKKASVTPEYCRIVAAGVAVNDDEVKTWLINTLEEEKEFLIELFGILKDVEYFSLVGYNMGGFDWPVILSRAIHHGVYPPRKLDLSPWKNDIIDVMIKRFGRFAPKGFGMKHLAECYCVDIPEDDTDGSMVYKLYYDGTEESKEKIVRYVKSDVEVVRDLYYKFVGYFI